MNTSFNMLLMICLNLVAYNVRIEFEYVKMGYVERERPMFYCIENVWRPND